MDNTLRLRVIFGAIDKLTAPVCRLQAGAKGLSKDIAATQHELAGLKRQENDLARYKGLEAQLRRTGAALDGARAHTESLRKSIEESGTPSKRMEASLARSERLGKKAAEAHERQGAAVQEMAGKLASAGIQVDSLAHHEDRLADRIANTSRALERQQSQAERMERFRNRGEAIKSAGGKIAGAGALATAGVTLPAVAFLKSSVEASRESAQAAAQAEAAVKSMKNASGFSLDQLQDMSGKLQDLSLFDDDDILQKVTANMLTFGNVAGTQFDRAQLMALNLSQRLGQDLQSSTIQLGKALNDPVKGITALQRVGVAFTADQKKQIKTLAEHGRVAQAQTLILNELDKEFGGAASAARAAAPDAALQQSWRGFQEQVGGLAEKQLPALIDNANRLLTTFNNLDAGTQNMILGAVAAGAALGPLMTIIGGVVSACGLLAPIIGVIATTLGVGTVAAVGIFVGAIALVAGAAYLIYRYWEPIKAFFGKLWDGVKNVFSGMLGWLQQAFAGGLGGLIGTVLRLGLRLGAALLGAIWSAITFVVSMIPKAAMLILTALALAFTTGLNVVFAAVKLIGQGLMWVFKGWGTLFTDAGRWLIQGLIGGIMSKLGGVKKAITGIAGSAVSWIKEKLGIHSPSRVFAAIGGHMMGGLAVGMDRGAAAPLTRLHRLGNQLTAAGAASALAAAPAAGAASPARGSATSLGRAAGGYGQVHIHIHQQPGEDAKALAERVRAELDATGRSNARRARSSYQDND